MFQNIENQIIKKYNQNEEYLIDHYPSKLITSYDKDLGLKTYAVLSNTVVSSADLLFWKDLL